MACDDGKYPFFTCSEKPLKINQYSFDTDALLISGNGHIGYIHKCCVKFDAYQRTYVLDNFKNIYKDYLYHYLKTRFLYYIELIKNEASVPYITLTMLEDFEVLIPDFPTQIKIANLLDTFDKFIDDINDGLPSEINLRKKQYEYYRNKLLNF